MYPENANGNGTSERTKSTIKKVLAPHKGENSEHKKRWIVIEAGTEKLAAIIKEALQKAHDIKCVEKKLKKPRIIIYDVDEALTLEELQKSLYTQNLEETGITEKVIK